MAGEAAQRKNEKIGKGGRGGGGQLFPEETRRNGAVKKNVARPLPGNGPHVLDMQFRGHEPPFTREAR